MQLSKNFSLTELYKSTTAIRNNINNEPTSDIIANLELLCVNVLQPIRDFFKYPVKINSGYRCVKLNQLVGGKPNSEHSLGMAADIEINGVSNYDLALYIKDNLQYTQLILEFYTMGDPNSGWVHVSYNVNDLKRENYTAVNSSGKVYYLRGLNP